jgi:filamentous hemagglutinin family protein
MKPKPWFFHKTRLFGTPLRYGAPLVIGFAVFISGTQVEARNILQSSGGGSGGAASASTTSGTSPTEAATPSNVDAARANANNLLRRTNQTLDAIHAVQNAARAAAAAGPNRLGNNLPDVPDGIGLNGLNPHAEAKTNASQWWQGADAPVQTVSGENVNVKVKQNAQQALLHWQTLNVGKKTTLHFDQSAGGANAPQWVAFNQIKDPSANPTQILGTIKSEGQVYLINPNGIIFGGSSTVNARGLTASSLPINTNLIHQGLLNNRDAQFLFSSIKVSGGSDGTKDFDPGPPPDSGKYGDVTVQSGAVLQSPGSASGNGGRIMLVGPNVTNAGSISTESGQTILAAGMQVAIAAHDSNDPSLRGLDVWVGAMEDYAGSATNAGLIEAKTASTSIVGKNIKQNGAIESTTSISLNGRIDLRASYGAVANPNYDSITELGAGGPMFFDQFTGSLSLGKDSLTRILPDYASDKKTPGLSLPERSQINLDGLSVHFDKASVLWAPNGEVTVRAGTWTYRDIDGNGTILDARGEDIGVEAGINNHYSGKNQKFFFNAGQIYVDQSANISVAGSVDVFTPLSHSVLDVKLLGAELADSPLQRDSVLRGKNLTVDTRITGTYNGRFWVGTPLGDVTGLLGLIERNAAQLTTVGGNISLKAGESVVLSESSTIDVSGGFKLHEPGMVNTTTLLTDGRLIDIANATPDQKYDGINTGEWLNYQDKWGVIEKYSNGSPGTRFSESFIEGSDAGKLSISAATVILNGNLKGIAINGPDQRDKQASSGQLEIRFEAQKSVSVPGGDAIEYITHSPTPPAIVFNNQKTQTDIPEFVLSANNEPAPLPSSLLSSLTLTPDLLDEEHFGSIEVVNPDGSITIAENTTLAASPKGSIKLAAANVIVLGDINASGGTIELSAFNLSPSFAKEYGILNPPGTIALPLPNASRGMVSLGANARLSVAGLIVDDTGLGETSTYLPTVIHGGNIKITTYSADLAQGSIIDASGGLHVDAKTKNIYGNGGSISLITGRDISIPNVTGGDLILGSELMGYAGGTGASLNIQTGPIQIGGTAASGVLAINPAFFAQGGFSQYSLTGIGQALGAPTTGQIASYISGVHIAENTVIRPISESLIAHRDKLDGKVSLVKYLKEDALRKPTSVSFNALGYDDPFTIDELETRGDILMRAGSSIVTDAQASVSFKGDTVTLLGSVVAQAGKISISGANSFPATTTQRLTFTQALPTVHISSTAQLIANGTVLLEQDYFGRRIGKVLSGGTVSVSGNIVGEKGSVIDVSGTSGILDVSPLSLSSNTLTSARQSSLLDDASLFFQGIETRIDSNGGMIDLTGGQMLLSDSTLLGKSGGSSAVGGTLSVSSGRFYTEGANRSSADINLQVRQSGDVIDYTKNQIVIGTGLVDGEGLLYGNMGVFSLDRFTEGSFSNLSLGGKYFETATPVPYGGNVEFKGAVDLVVPGKLRLTAGGVIKADSTVSIRSSYLAIGQEFRDPLNPSDINFPFKKDPAIPTSRDEFAPSIGEGQLSFSASTIDIGTLSLQNIYFTGLDAGTGEIRGSGTIHTQGQLSLVSSQVYPTSLSSFDIFAYEVNDWSDTTNYTSGSVIRFAGNYWKSTQDSNGVTPSTTLAWEEIDLAYSDEEPAAWDKSFSYTQDQVVSTGTGDNTKYWIALEENTGNIPSNDLPWTLLDINPELTAGTVEIHGTMSSKMVSTPLSAGGELSIQAANIVQNGILRAPMGSIVLGWDGIDSNKPVDPIANSTIPSPITKNLKLSSTSVTSVSGIDETGKDWISPFGISQDGQSWIDPRGVNITTSGLAQKTVKLSGSIVDMDIGSTVDIRGGGDLFASRWIPGNGGSINLLGSTEALWTPGNEYKAGELVRYTGETWSARVKNSGQSPTISQYWSKVPKSFAILPSSNLSVAPYNAYNSGSNANALSGDYGYTDINISAGDTITLEGSDIFAAGTYTLLPSKYALIPGAVLVTPVAGSGIGVYQTLDGAVQVSGFTSNSFNRPSTDPSLRTRFEIASQETIKQRANYETYSANKFLGDKAVSLELSNPQELPRDAGYASFQSDSSLRLAGKVLTQSTGSGARIDISSTGIINILGAGSGAGDTISGQSNLDASTLSSWGAASLLIGGIRHEDSTGISNLEVRTNRINFDNGQTALTAPDIILASTEILKIANGSSIEAIGGDEFEADELHASGDGTLVRISTDTNTTTLREKVTGSDKSMMTIGSNVQISGKYGYLDSTYGTQFANDALINTSNLILASGQISIGFDGATVQTANSLITAPHLVLNGNLLTSVQQTTSLTLRSYSDIDIYGNGTLGGESIENLSLLGNGIRAYQNGDGDVLIEAQQITFGNPNKPFDTTPSTDSSGTLQVSAKIIQLTAGDFSISGYQDINLSALNGIFFDGKGSLSSVGNIQTQSPFIIGSGGSNYQIKAGGVLALDRNGNLSPDQTSLGATLALEGSSIFANTFIELNSGKISLKAIDGDIQIGGTLSVAGIMKNFNDVTRYSNAGTITLESLTGDVLLEEESLISVAASSSGGNAGTLEVKSGLGSFVNLGSITGSASENAISGSFLLDVYEFDAVDAGSLTSINQSLDAGGFYQSRNFRTRNGNVIIDHDIRARDFSMAADNGSITVTHKIDASGITGGKIALTSRDSLTLENGAALTVAAELFDSAGKGGSILLEAGTQRDGNANLFATLGIKAGASLDLSVAEFKPGKYDTVGSSAFEGKFTGTLHLRAPRTAGNDGILIDPIAGTITGASSILAEGFKVYQPLDGILNIAQRDLIDSDAKAFLGNSGVGNANEAAMRAKLLNGSTSIDSILVIAPGAELINPTGDLILGLANSSSSGTTNKEAVAEADWDLSGFRYGKLGAAGVLTLRAQGDLIFNNTLSDGFTPIAQGSAQEFADKGHSLMWLAPLAKISDALPINLQSWSYRLSAGADTNASSSSAVLGIDQISENKGSILVGEFYPAVPNNSETGLNAGIGTKGQTADTIRISNTTTNKGNRFEVIRTGTGIININAGRDVQLRNQFATIYTAGVATTNANNIFSANDFITPIIPTTNIHPSQSGAGLTLGEFQQVYQPAWSMAGGNINIQAGQNIARYTLTNDELTIDSSRQMPTNWLYRRGHVDPTTGLFADNGGVDRVTDTATSTTWWIDYSNFFQGVGTLGGGNVAFKATKDVINVDAVAPTNARMAGRDASTGKNLAPDETKLLEWGGGDVTIQAGSDISGGIYYVERGKGTLSAGNSITTNAARTPTPETLAGEEPLGSSTWLPTTLFAGKSGFDVVALGDILLGPVANTFMMPQGLNNKYWYKTYFSTLSSESSLSATSYGGDITHRNAATLPESSSASNILANWFSRQNLYVGESSAFNSSHYQPWIRLMETDLSNFSSAFTLTTSNFSSASFGGDINLVGSISLSPSAIGNLELFATGQVNGLNPTGEGLLNGEKVQVWTSSSINVSDADPDSIPRITSPLAYQTLSGRDKNRSIESTLSILQGATTALSESGSYSGQYALSFVKSALHGGSILHKDDKNPIRIYALGSDISGLTLYAPKQARVMAERDITDMALYIQNTDKNDITLVSAGRDILPYNESSPTRSLANDLAAGNSVGDEAQGTVAGSASNAMAGDIQISGPGVLEVLSGRNIDLGTGANYSNGTGLGITSIGNNRNPNLPFTGADIIALSGVTAASGAGPADGIANSSMRISDFTNRYLTDPESFTSAYRQKLANGMTYDQLSIEQRAIVGLEKFYAVLNQSGKDALKTEFKDGDYEEGYTAIKTLFGAQPNKGEILTRAREIRTITGGSISLSSAAGGITMASEIFGNPLTPPGIVTEYGGSISTFTDGSVDIGQARIFTLRGGDIMMWSSKGNIAAGTAARTVVTAPPTRVVIDVNSANVETDLGGLATGGGIGVLASVEGVKEASVGLFAPKGFIDAGDAGIRATGNIQIGAQVVLNSSNINSGGTTTGATVAAPSAPSVSSVTSASNSSAASTASTPKPAENKQDANTAAADNSLPTVYTVEVIGYGGGSGDDEEDDEEKKSEQKSTL